MFFFHQFFNKFIIDFFSSFFPTSIQELKQMAYEPKHFEIPQVSVNTEGWGPCSFNEKFTKLPFHIYNKEEPISKIIEFHQQGSMHKSMSSNSVFLMVECR